MSTRRRWTSASAIVLVLAILLGLTHHAITSFVLQRALGVALGYDVHFGDMRLGWTHATFTDVHVGKNGDPVFDAARVDVDYALRDIFPGGKHRYGFLGIAVDQPTLTLVRHADGSYNFNRGGTSSSPPAATQAAAEPLLFSARVRDGTIKLVDAAPLEPDLGEQAIVGVALDASVQSNARTVARIDGTLVGRRSPAAPIERWPLSDRSVIDYTRGFAMHRVRAPALPLRGMLNFLIHAKIARFDDGVMRNLDVRAYAIGIVAETPFGYRLGGGGTLDGAQVALEPLAKPIRDLHGRIDLFDDGFTTSDLRGTVARIPLRIRGGMYDLANLRFRIGVSADPQLAQVRELFTFLRDQPIRGPMHLETLVSSTLAHPLIRTVVSSPRIYYGTIPLERAGGIVDYAEGDVSFGGFHADFGAVHSAIVGEIPVGPGGGTLAGLVHIDGPASELPYAQAVAAGETISGDAIIGGSGDAGFHARGTIGAVGPNGSGAGFIAVDEKGRGEFGPFIFQRADGSTLAGALRLERPISSSAGWASIQHYRFDVPGHAALLPGVDLPGFPPIGGIVDAALVAGGAPNDFAVAGHVVARSAQFERYPLGTVTADLGGTFDDLRIANIRLDGPIGRFRGNGAVAGGTFGVRGAYDGSLADLRPFTGEIGARGTVHAPVWALADSRGVTVQTTGAALRSGSIHGVALDAAAGTMVVSANGLRIVTGNATLDGAHAVVAARGNETAVSMVGVPAAAFAGSGLPLEAGRVSVFGVGNLQRLAFRGSVDLDGGAALGYPVGGWADIAFGGGQLRVLDGTAALGSTYARLGGRLDDIGSPAFRYDIDASVPLGDVDSVVGDLRLPVRYAEGSFAAKVKLTGDGAAPTIAATFTSPEGAYNGLAFHDGAGRLITTPGGALRVDEGRVVVGTTHAAFRASVTAGALGVAASSPDANLADFDDYFDQSEVLAGTGALSFTFANDGRTTSSSGRVALSGARVRRFPLGSVAAAWATSARTIHGEVSLNGPAGAVHAAGTIAPARGGPLAALRAARYDADIQGTGVDLGTFLPAAGIHSPILGRVAATGHISGVFPRLAIGGHLALAGGVFGRFPVTSAEVTTRALGDRISLQEASADLGFVRFTASGTVGLGPADPLALRVHASVPDLTVAARRVLPRRPLDVAGSLEADALVAGSFAHPRITAGFDLEKPRYERLLVQRIVGNAESDLHSLILDSAEFVLNHGTAVVAGSLPILLNPAGIGPAEAPLSITADAHSVELAALAPLLPGSGTKLSGTLDGHLALEGTVRSPRILGTMSLSDGAYVSSLETSPIRNAAAQLAFEGTSVALQALHASVGSGSLDAHGQLNLPIAGAPAQGYSVDVIAKGAQIYTQAFGGATVDGTAQIVSGPRLPTLSGDITLSHASIPFAAIFRSASVPPETAGSAPLFDIGFDLRTHVKDVRIKSAIIDVGAAGDLTLTGSLSAPRAAGEFTATRGGVFSTYQRLFRIQDATVTFNPDQGIVPNLNLHATAHVDNPDPDFTRNAIGSADITVSVTGPADAYTISYASDPPYSQAQIVALLVNLPVLGSLNFGGAQQLPGTLRGAPGESDVLLPPGVTPYRTVVTPLQQEAFSLLNTQLTQRLVSPLENAFGGAVGLTDVQFTLDYGGRVGYTARQQLSRKHAVYATLGQILTYPTRTQVGFQSRPDAWTSIGFTYFQQNGTPYYTNSIFGNTNSVQIQNGIQPLSNRQGFSLVLTRTYR